MGESLIQHVSDTAFWIAAYRAAESRRGDALFHDPLASLLADSHGEQIAREMGEEERMAWMVAVRTHIIDEMIVQAMANGADTIVNLGAGLDTRPYRICLPQSLRWIEADFPNVISFKLSRLAGRAPLCRLESIKADLADAAARSALLARIDAEGENIFVLTEGVIPYLTDEQVMSLALDLGRQSHVRTWVTDYLSPQFKEIYQTQKLFKRLEQGAPMRFFPENWPVFFADLGWSVRQIRYLGEEGERLKRPAPLPWLIKAIYPLLSQARKDNFLHMSGYAVLEKTRN